MSSVYEKKIDRRSPTYAAQGLKGLEGLPRRATVKKKKKTLSDKTNW